MHLRRYSTLLWVSAIVLLFALLTILASLQIRWIDRITRAERERRQAHLQAAASRLVQEFDRD